MSKQPYQILFNMFDDDYRKMMEEQGIQVGLGVFAPTGTKIPDVAEAMKASIEKDEAWICDTIEELCKKTGMDPQSPQWMLSLVCTQPEMWRAVCMAIHTMRPIPLALHWRLPIIRDGLPVKVLWSA